ncbi:beta-ketoacyl-ACP synthase [Thalassospira tepidiphila]|jgi:3-oxoacyl-[acyl-carrier-protein] synthase II|uniref:beta-ketoacyl-ACP synthase n=1 Tax=Thalassospira TaxID=168934 RepID=UPI000EE053A7|nr:MULTISPECIES: beta-ketoacyl-ACP synthase [Thalassospira]MBS8272807.1 beta-ketoacyl-ACP synthase [Thalassospira tepidiphila]HAI30419.1 beta-ketoacyl-ACP synthase [Thalassospira sp.]|tara:strand:+ start:17686 stop:18921 length:1236 start_codon:yes stop_codon:yes gene_type:complete
MTRRVVVTGMSGITALGNDWQTIKEHMQAGKTGVVRMSEWDDKYDLRTRLAAPVKDFSLKGRFNRKQLRSMGRVAQMAVAATDDALEMAGLRDDTALFEGGRLGIAYGSSFGSTPPVLGFTRLMEHGDSNAITATSYIQMMSHTTAVNIGVLYGITGRIIPTSTACTSGSMGIGYAYETIKYGKQDVMIAGGAEELCPTMVAVFDTLFATSVNNDTPEATPRPYDVKRDGLVIGEGAGTLILEEYEHAKARGAKILGEISGFATNSDGSHITHPASQTMARALQGALDDAELSGYDIDIVSGHGTATDHGDIAESEATRTVFDRAVPIHTLKGHFGHSLGACGAIEAWLGLEMMRERNFIPTANLSQVDPACAELDYISASSRNIHAEHLMSNNFAFGGINTSLIFKYEGY